MEKINQDRSGVPVIHEIALEVTHTFPPPSP
jgi:hypothetical protein